MVITVKSSGNAPLRLYQGGIGLLGCLHNQVHPQNQEVNALLAAMWVNHRNRDSG